MEKLDKLSDYEDYRFWNLDEGKTVLFATLVCCFVIFVGCALIGFLSVGLDTCVIVVMILGILSLIPVAIRFCHCYSKEKKFNALHAEFKKIDNQIDMLKYCFDYRREALSPYHKLYSHLNSCNNNRYKNGKIEKYYYIDELFFGKLKSYIALTKVIENATLDEEDNQQLMQIKQILDKSADDYYNKMINYQNSQAKTSLKVTLDVFKEVD